MVGSGLRAESLRRTGSNWTMLLPSLLEGLGARRKEICWATGSLNGFNSDFQGGDQIDTPEECPWSSRADSWL